MFIERSKVLCPDISSIFAEPRLPPCTGIYLMQTSTNCKLTTSHSDSPSLSFFPSPTESCCECELRLAVFSSDQSHDETSFWRV